MVMGSFILFNAISRKKQKKNESLHDEFEQTILENSQNHEIQLKRVEHMQKEHDVRTAYENVHHNPFVRPQPDPLLEELNKPVNVEVARFQPQEEEDEQPLVQDEKIRVSAADEKPKTHGFIALTIIPKSNAQFSSITLQSTLTKYHFRYGAQKLYHRHVQDNPALPALYSVANLAKPGYFESMTQGQTFPGILIYLLLDEVEDPITAFEKMLTSARQLSASLHAELCDAKRQPISTTVISQYREQAKAAAPVLEKEYQEW